VKGVADSFIDRHRPMHFGESAQGIAGRHPRLWHWSLQVLLHEAQHMRARALCPLPQPIRGALADPLVCLRLVRLVGRVSAHLHVPGMLGDPLSLLKDLHSRGGQPDIQGQADQPMRNRIRMAADMDAPRLC
jgi:hypothetical protein